MYKNIGFFFLILLVFVVLGFYYPYFSLFPDFKSVTVIVHFHAIILMIWVIILIVQPILIRYQKYKAHRFLGRFTYFLLPLVIISSIGVIRQQYYESIEQKMTSLQSLKLVFTSVAGIFSILIYYSFAIINILKGNVALHIRYMICLFLQFIPPTFGRTLGYWFGIRQFYTYNISILLSALILVLLILADKRRKLNFTPYVVALSLYLIVNGIWYALGHPIWIKEESHHSLTLFQLSFRTAWVQFEAFPFFIDWIVFNLECLIWI